MTEAGDNRMTNGLVPHIENIWHCHCPSVCPGGCSSMGGALGCCPSRVDFGSHGTCHGDPLTGPRNGVVNNGSQEINYEKESYCDISAPDPVPDPDCPLDDGPDCQCVPWPAYHYRESPEPSGRRS